MNKTPGQMKKWKAILIATMMFNSGMALAQVKVGGNVYGGGELGKVTQNTSVTLQGGTIGTASVLQSGNVYGGGEGSETDPTHGQVQGNATVTIDDGLVRGNVHGGGAMASVGTLDDAQNPVANTGSAKVILNGGQIGIEAEIGTEAGQREAGWTLGDNGHVYGGCKGKAGQSFLNYGLTINSEVVINSGFVVGSVYGGGESGHVLGDSKVTMVGGTVGQRLALEERKIDKNGYGTRIMFGNVHGGGSGIEDDHSPTHFSVTAGRVYGNSSVEITNGHVRHGVFGGGEMASVGEYDDATFAFSNGGKTIVTIEGNALIGPKKDDLIKDANGNSYTQAEIDSAFKYLGNNEGFVYGASRGISNEALSGLVFVDSTMVTIQGNAQVVGMVYGGSEDGHVHNSTTVNIKGNSVIGGLPLHGTSYTATAGEYAGVTMNLTEVESEEQEDPVYSTGRNVFRGNIYGGGRGIDKYENANHNMVYSHTAGRVYGNTHVNVSESAQIYNTVYGGGAIASVGDFVYHSTVTDSIIGILGDNGKAYVNITGGTIGTSGRNNGSVFGGGRGIASPINDPLIHLAYVAETHVNISGTAAIKNSVYGGGANGHVQGDTYVNIVGGTIGTTGLGGYHSNVYGGGGGNERYIKNGKEYLSLTAGRVFGNTNIEITGGQVMHNVYGGGAIASVGTYDLTPGATNPFVSGGTANVTIKGNAIIGTDGDSNGLVFGSGRGQIAPPGAFLDTLSYTTNTFVTIGSSTSTDNPRVHGSVYGSGENGHVFLNTQVDVYNGTIGCTAEEYAAMSESDKLNKFPYMGNVYGGGCGTDQYKDASNVDQYNAWSGLVSGNSLVNIYNGNISRNVYGGGAMASVGRNFDGTTNTNSKSIVNLYGGQIGLATPDDTYGYIYGGPRGTDSNYDENLALSANTQVNIYDGTYHAVLGGGENGQIAMNTEVNLYGGTVSGNLYGGGRGVWGETGHSNDTVPGRVLGNATVNLLAGTIGLDVFGGSWRSNIWGDATVNVGLENMTVQGTTYTGTTFNGNVYGANNANGTPYGDIFVNVYHTAHTQANTYPTTPSGGWTIQALHANGLTQEYAINQVFGGGKQSNYTPHNPTRTAKETTVHVFECENTIRNVFGGGDAAQVGTESILADANIIIDGGRIHHVFGGGNGDPNDASIYGTASTLVNGGLIDVVYGAGNKLGTVLNTNLVVLDDGDCDMLIDSIFGGSNVSPIEGDLNTTIACADGSYENIYGGSNNAEIKGNVTLNIKGNTITNVFGGSKGSLGDHPMAAHINGNVTLNLYGGTITNAFGGSDMNGNISGVITVNVIDQEEPDCELDVTYVYGGSNATAITASDPSIISPVVNVVHIKQDEGIRKEVFGGSKGLAAVTTSNPMVNIGYDNTMTLPEGYSVPADRHVVVSHHVHGGGELADVIGNTTVNINEGTIGLIEYTHKKNTPTSQPFDSIVHVPNAQGSVFGGGFGNLAHADYAKVTGNTNVNIKGGHVLYSVYGAGELASVTGKSTVTVTGGQVGPAPKVGEFDGLQYKIPIGLNGVDGYVFGGGQGKGDDPLTPAHPYGLYYQFANVGSTEVVVNIPAEADTTTNRLWGSVFGGAEDGHVIGNTYVHYISGLMGTKGTTSYDGNIFGGGRNFSKLNYTAGRVGGNTLVEMDGGQIYGSIYGGGRMALTGIGETGPTQNGGTWQAVQDGPEHGNTKVVVNNGKVGNEALIKTFTASSMGEVFGGGKGDMKMKGIEGHPQESALLISLVKNSEVEINGGTVYGTVYGGGEVANVGNYTWQQPNATTIENIQLGSDGLAKVTITGGQIGPDRMQMRSTLAPGTYDLLYNDDIGHVYGGGEGLALNPADFPTIDQNYNNTSLINLMSTVGHTEVTIKDDAWVKGSVYGGGGNGHIRGDTWVKIQGGQIGSGKTAENVPERKYTEAEFLTSTSLAGCPHWPYDLNTDIPYDPVLVSQGQLPSDGETWFGNVFGGGSGFYPYIVTTASGATSHWNPESGKVYGNSKVEITGGHILTNVFGGGEINDIVGDSTIVLMSGGTVGVPATKEEIDEAPVSCFIFGGGKGDARTIFNETTNVNGVRVHVSGGWVYGSVYGGAEDGHVLKDVKLTVSNNAKIGIVGYSIYDGNVFGAGRGFAGDNLTAGLVKGNVTVNIKGGEMLGSVYGGGRQASVGIDLTGEMLPDDANGNHGHVTVNVSGGTIGNTYESVTHHIENPQGGNVYGGGMGRIAKPDGVTANPIWPNLGRVKQVNLNISGNAVIMNNAYGGGKFGVVEENTAVAIAGGTIWRDVYGAGHGSDNLTNIGELNVYTESGGTTTVSTVEVTPMHWAGRVQGNADVTITDGWIKKSVYGGGELASVGTIEEAIKHEAPHPFHISWPYKFVYKDGTGDATVTITGGRIGMTGKDYMGPWDAINGTPIGYDEFGTPYNLTDAEIKEQREDNGDLFGGGKGISADRYVEAECANVNNTTVTIGITSSATPGNYKDLTELYDCIAGAVYGGGENGHVNTNAHTILNNGLIGHAIYGGGKGKDTYKTNVVDPNTNTSSEQDVYSITAGKVYGNTYVTINGGQVLRSIFGGGNLASVGIGNFAGGYNDYNPNGYGEIVSTSEGWNDTLNSGHTYVQVLGGTLGMLPLDPTDPESVFKDHIPYGSVFGGCRGMAIPDVTDSQIAQLFESRPDVFLSYVNHTHVTIGDATHSPRLYGSVFGGAQDGHIRWNSNVVVNNGEIGAEYGVDDVGSDDLTSVYWTDRGNVFGGGSGIGTYEEGGVEHNSSIAGSVSQKTNVTVNGGTIYRNVYGGGNLATVGPPRLTQDHDCRIDSTCVTVNINADALIGTHDDYGGYVYGGSRGKASNTKEFENYALCGHTVVNINGATINKDVFGGGENGQVAVANSTELSHTTLVVVDGSSALIKGNVYGGGQGIWGETGYENDDISGMVMGTATVNLNDGTVRHNAYGGGRLGVTHGPTYVNVSGSTVDENVFGGAYGQRHQIHVLGMRMVNMRNGLVRGNVYGGSFNAIDALTANPGDFATSTSDETVSVVNYSGGHTAKHVFGAGDHGNTFGSTYVFIGTNAIMNAPYHTATTGVDDPYNEAFYSDHGDLIIDRDVWAGADFGEYTQGAVFGESTISGRSNIYVDGTGYDTENTASQGDDLYMVLRNSIFGCGTLNDGGRQGKQVMIRDYGHDVAHVPDENDPEPYSDATRLLYSIQYADSLIIESSHIRMKGRGIVNINEATEEYAIYNIFDDVRVVNGSSLFIDKPVNNIGNLHSNVSNNLANHQYPATPAYTEVGYAELAPNVSTTPDNKDNKIRINKGGYLTVSITETTSGGTATTYGALRGFFHLMADGVYNAFAYARPKQSIEPGNTITQLEHNYDDDGGFVCYRAALNIYDVEGGRAEQGIQMPYENHTPDQRGNEFYFRVWRFKEHGQSVLDVVLHAFAKPNDSNGFSYYTGTVTLPPQNGTGSYYRIKSSGGSSPVAEINYGSELRMVNAGYAAPTSTSDWMYYDKVNGTYVYNAIDTVGDITFGKSFMEDHPNNVFGLTAIPAGGLVSSTNNPWLICANANDFLAADNSRWNNNGTSAAPQVMFMLTHSNKVNGNHSWDPISITLQQWVGDQMVDEVTVHVQVVTSTNIEQNSEVDTYAMMTHSSSSSLGNHLDIYKTKVLLPTYTLVTGAQEYSTWSLKKVEWKPNTEAGANQIGEDFDDNTLVVGQPYAGGYTPTHDFVGLNFFTSDNVDNVNGWLDQGVTSANPIDVGTYKMDGDSNPITSPIYMGTTKGVDPISFEFNLLYDSKQNIGLQGNADMGVVELTLHFDNYENGEGTDHGKDVKFLVNVHRRGKGKGFYIDGVNGDFMYSGKFPDAAQPSLAGILYFAEDYEPVDSIFIVNKVTADAVTLLNWSTPYDELRLFRYNGGHLLHQTVPGHSEDYYHEYKTTYPNNPAYKGALVDVKTVMSVSSTIVDGAYDLVELSGYPHAPTPEIPHPTGDTVADHVISDGPMFNIMEGASLTINGINGYPLDLKNNYNKSTNGGAINIASGGILKMNQRAYIHDNYVADDGSEVHYGGGAYLEGSATILASDDVLIDGNKHVNGSSTINENVYLNDYQTMISVGTSDGTDTYGPLDASSKIGITKNAWGTTEYMPIVFTENTDHGTNLISDGTYYASQIVFDEDHTYGLVEYPLRQANDDLNYKRKLYWVKTWVNAVTMKPEEYNANEIDTPEELAWAISVANGLNGCPAAPATHFNITADIDMSQYIWVPIGNNTNKYAGEFEGNGHLVTGIHSPFSMENKGMFGTVNGADIKNLQVVTDFYQGNATNLGGIIGSMESGTLSNCESAGYLESGSTGVGFIGGLVGKTYTGSTIHSSFAVDTLKALSEDMYLGGLVGEHSSGNLYNSYGRILIADGTLTQTDKVGGLVGYNEGIVENCYSDVGVQNIAALAYENHNGIIQYCYSNEDMAEDYIGTVTGSGTISGHGTYEPVKGRKEIGYLYGDNAITLVSGTSNYVHSGDISYDENEKRTFNWNGLLWSLNKWVKEKNDEPSNPLYGMNFTNWFRPTSEFVNADLPVLGFPKDNAMATLDADGRFLQYSATTYDANHANAEDNGLDGLLEAYKGKASSIFLYDNAIEVTKWPVGDEKVFVNEDAVLLQAATSTGDFGNTTVGITFDNSSREALAYGGTQLEYDWHLMSTPLSNAKVGATYSHVDGSNNYLPDTEHTYQESPVDIESLVDGYFPNGLKMDAGYNDDVKWDFYSYFEPQYHWINLKRNKNNHFHQDALQGIHDETYQLDANLTNYYHNWIDYTESDQANVKAASGEDGCIFTPGKGYMMAISQESYMNSTGILNKDVSIDITAEAPDDLEGYPSHDRGSNLVGNPYQAYLDLNQVSTSTVNPGLDKFWVYEADYGTGIYVPYYKEASTNKWTPSRWIHPHQGFFVVSDETTTMTFTPSMAGTLKDDESYFRNQGRPAYPLVNLLVSNEQGASDLAIVEFNRPEVGGVPKIENLRNAEFKLYARFEDENYGLLFTPRDTQRVPVFFKTPTTGTYTLRWDTQNGTFKRMRLIDNITGTDYDMLSNDHYTFQANNTDYAARFYIVFDVTSVDENEDENEIFAYFNGEGWVVEGEGQLELVDMLGHVLYADQLHGQPTIVHFDSYAAGMYMLRLVNSQKVLKAQKIVIQ